jgi:hypothetical protein
VSTQSGSACGLGGATCGGCGPGRDCVNGACAALANACLEVTPDVNFGFTTTGCATARTLKLTNRCTVPLSLDSMTFSPSANFTTTTPPSWPMSLLAGASTTVGLRFYANGVADVLQVGAARINWTASSQANTNTVGLFGGVAATTTTETFVMPTKVDVLLVVDDSASMTDKQSSLAANIGTLLGAAATSNLDWAAAVINHDDMTSPATTSSGNFLGTPKVITRSLPSAQATLAARAQPGINGSAIEVGLMTSWKALSPPLITAGNVGFLRPDAALAVVYVTDAEDQSAFTPAEAVDHFMAIKGQRALNRVSFSGLVPTGALSGTCSYDTAPSGRYQAVIAAFGGAYEEVCNHAAAAPWQRLGDVIAGRRARYFLAAKPASASGITVRVGGVALPTGSFTYDAATNSVVPAASLPLPIPGQPVTATFTPACVP